LILIARGFSIPMQNVSPERDKNESLAAKRNWAAPLARSAMILALLFAAVLLVSNIPAIPSAVGISAPVHTYFGSAALALAGIGYALLQIALRPSRQTLLKRLLLAATFVAWAVDQLLPAGPIAVLVGDAVIAAYVLDLFWITQEQREAR